MQSRVRAFLWKKIVPINYLFHFADVNVIQLTSLTEDVELGVRHAAPLAGVVVIDLAVLVSERVIKLGEASAVHFGNNLLPPQDESVSWCSLREVEDGVLEDGHLPLLHPTQPAEGLDLHVAEAQLLVLTVRRQEPLSICCGQCCYWFTFFVTHFFHSFVVAFVAYPKYSIAEI